MSILKCPECGHDVSSEATSCPNCGYPMKKEEQNYVGPDPIDPSWMKKYKKKALLVKSIQTYVTVVLLALTITFRVLFIRYLDEWYWEVYLILWLVSMTAFFYFLVSSIVSWFLVRVKTFNMDGYNIVVYRGYIRSQLVIEDVVIDSMYASAFRNTDIFTKLPNGKRILVRFSGGSASICENRYL